MSYRVTRTDHFTCPDCGTKFTKSSTDIIRDYDTIERESKDSDGNTVIHKIHHEVGDKDQNYDYYIEDRRCSSCESKYLKTLPFKKRVWYLLTNKYHMNLSDGKAWCLLGSIPFVIIVIIVAVVVGTRQGSVTKYNYESMSQGQGVTLASTSEVRTKFLEYYQKEGTNCKATEYYKDKGTEKSRIIKKGNYYFFGNLELDSSYIDTWVDLSENPSKAVAYVCPSGNTYVPSEQAGYSQAELYSYAQAHTLAATFGAMMEGASSVYLKNDCYMFANGQSSYVTISSKTGKLKTAQLSSDAYFKFNDKLGWKIFDTDLLYCPF